MRKRLTTPLTVIILLLSIAAVTNWQLVSPVFSESQTTVDQKVEEARVKLNQAFNATLEAENVGANVKDVATQLNQALNYTVQAETALSRGDSEQAAFSADTAIQLSDDAMNQVTNLRAQATTTRILGLIAPVVVAVVLVLAGIFIFIYGRRFWSKRRENEFLRMRVKRSASEAAVQPNKASDTERRRINEEKTVIVAVLAGLILVSGLLIYVTLTPPIPENFATVYILNSAGMANNLPGLLVLGKNNTFSLRVGVENYMGRIEHGILYAKVANGTLQRGETLPEETVMSFERILDNRETWEFPVTLTLNQTGVYRVSFELWLYDEVNSVFVYPHVISGLWLEVVA